METSDWLDWAYRQCVYVLCTVRTVEEVEISSTSSVKEVRHTTQPIAFPGRRRRDTKPVWTEILICAIEIWPIVLASADGDTILRCCFRHNLPLIIVVVRIVASGKADYQVK